MTIRFVLSTLLMAVFTALLMTACERHGAVSDLQAYLQEIRESETKKKRVNLMTEIKVPAMEAYAVEALRSPFGAVEMGAGDGSSTNPLLAYPITVLKFVGTLTQGKTLFAFVMTPDNMVYQVKVGDQIGDHQGKVISIQSSRLNIMEKDTENGSASMQRIVTLELKEGL